MQSGFIFIEYYLFIRGSDFGIAQESIERIEDIFLSSSGARWHR
ncbi:hypothetical protein UNH65_21260 [Chitinophaga sp. 180180018-2]|nr:hypothetical protein [Chitinophaga sp. 212800010-3]